MARKSITGRDGYINGKALLYAIAHIQSLPSEKREWSDMMDMCALARTLLHPEAVALHARDVLRHTGIMPEIWPDDGEEHSPKEQDQRTLYITQYQATVDKLTAITQAASNVIRLANINRAG